MYQSLNQKVPRDNEDERFVKCFTPDQIGNKEFAQFFDQYGFVVVRDALSADECTKTLDEMFRHLEKNHPGFDRSDPKTWSKWVSESFGMVGKTPIFSPQIVHNRQNLNVYRAFASVIGTTDLRVNHDRWAIYRPTCIVGKQYATPDNIHLDINPWRFIQNDPKIWATVDALDYSSLRDFVVENNHVTISSRGKQVQGIINLADNYENDGGLVVVAGFHRLFEEWVNTLGQMNDPECRFKIADYDVLQKFATRVTCRAGSLVIWDQRLVHGSKSNNSEQFRGVQFIKMFDGSRIPPKRAKARRLSIQRQLKQTMIDVNDIGRTVFGFKQ